jgi:hypothetical protein
VNVRYNFTTWTQDSAQVGGDRLVVGELLSSTTAWPVRVCVHLLHAVSIPEGAGEYAALLTPIQHATYPNQESQHQHATQNIFLPNYISAPEANIVKQIQRMLESRELVGWYS